MWKQKSDGRYIDGNCVDLAAIFIQEKGDKDNWVSIDELINNFVYAQGNKLGAEVANGYF